jgi:hypothetical protein
MGRGLKFRCLCGGSFYSNFNFLKETVRVEGIQNQKIKNQELPGDKITIIKRVPGYSLGPSTNTTRDSDAKNCDAISSG